MGNEHDNRDIRLDCPNSFGYFIFGIFRSKKNSKNSEAVKALQMVIDVSEETQTYLQKRVVGVKRSQETEYRLAECWSKASFMMSRINKDLSVRLYDKSQFWRNPDTWDGKKIIEKNISLFSVTETARNLMMSYA